MNFRTNSVVCVAYQFQKTQGRGRGFIAPVAQTPRLYWQILQLVLQARLTPNAKGYMCLRTCVEWHQKVSVGSKKISPQDFLRVRTQSVLTMLPLFFPPLTQKEKWVWLVRLGTEVHSQLKFKTVFCMYYYIPYCGVPNHMSYMCHHYIKVDYVYLIAVQCLILDDKYINLKCNQRWQNRAYVHKIHPSHYSTYLICCLTYTSSVTCITPLRTVVAYMLQGN